MLRLHQLRITPWSGEDGKMASKTPTQQPTHHMHTATTGTNGLSPVDDSKSKAGRRVLEAVYWARYDEHPDFNYEWNQERERADQLAAKVRALGIEEV
jgi:hypothetical protein